MSTPPRGIRNNNPGNIRISTTPWLGKVQPNTDGAFEQFSTAVYGIRAACVIFHNYYRAYGLNTVTGIINRWAPPNENDTSGYVTFVCTRMQVGPDDVLDIPDPTVLQNLVTAVIWQENGQQPYDSGTLAQGVQAALGPAPPAAPVPTTT